MRCCFALLVVSVLAAGIGAASAQPSPTPRARALAVDVDNAERTLFVVAEPSQEPQSRFGFYLLCDRARRVVEVGFSFGTFPPGKPVQAAVRRADGTAERFGPLVRGAPGSGFHSPSFSDPGIVRRAVSSVFTSGALVSNGHNSVWNELPPSVNG